MNSINLGIREELDQIITDVQTSKETRVVVVTGSGEKAFCAGMDVADVANIDKGPNGIDVCNKVERSLKPVIAVINGHALGGGCELAMACHYSIMTDKSNPDRMSGIESGAENTLGEAYRECPESSANPKALDLF